MFSGAKTLFVRSVVSSIPAQSWNNCSHFTNYIETYDINLHHGFFNNFLLTCIEASKLFLAIKRAGMYFKEFESSLNCNAHSPKNQYTAERVNKNQI
jgi:hypothetical protein